MADKSLEIDSPSRGRKLDCKNVLASLDFSRFRN